MRDIQCDKAGDVLEVPVTLFVYMIALISFVGWALFVLFGGIGLTALPMDLINDYRTRPQPIELAEYAQRKQTLCERATRLIEVGEKMDVPTLSKKTRTQKKAYVKFKKVITLIIV